MARRYRMRRAAVIGSTLSACSDRDFGKQKTTALGRFAWVAGFILSIILGKAAMAQTTPLSRPEPDKGPTVVKTIIFLADIDSVDTPGQSFEANAYFEFEWKDPRLAHGGDGQVIYSLSEVWHPSISVVNRQRVWSVVEPSLKVDGSGVVTLVMWYWGSFSQPLDLAEFPFDEQEFNILVVADGHTENTVRFEKATTYPSGIAPKLSVADWRDIHGSLVVEPYVPLPGGPEVSSVTFRFHAIRRTGYYWVKVILPLMLIVALSWVVFWIDPTDSGTQIGVAMTAMLTLIAYRFAIGASLPQLSYLSRLDYLILAATVHVFASLPEVLTTSSLARSGRVELARRIDWWARILFPCTFTLFLLDALVFRILL